MRTSTPRSAAVVSAVLVASGVAQELPTAEATASTVHSHAARRTLVIGTDLPLQGALADSSADMNRMVQLYLDRFAGYQPDALAALLSARRLDAKSLLV